MNAQETKTKRASGLIFAVVLLFVILGMVITLSSVTMLETKMSQKTKSSIGAFYNSESGVEWALNKIANSSGILSGTLSANPDGSVNCSVSPDCKVYFLKNDGTVITKADFSTLTFNDIKAVRSIGSQGVGGAADSQRAIEAAVASGGSDCWCTATDIKMTLPTHNGNFGGYKAMSDWIQANGCSGYHVCDAIEITRYMQKNDSLPLDAAWVNSGSGVFGSEHADCGAWRNGDGRDQGVIWVYTNGYGIGNYLLGHSDCGFSAHVMCCK